jgi:hypothetical protein
MNSVQKAVLIPYEVYQRYIGDESHSDTILKKYKSVQPLNTEDPHSDINLKKHKSLSTKDPKGLIGSDVMDPSKETCRQIQNPKRKNPSNVYKKAAKKQRWLTS